MADKNTEEVEEKNEGKTEEETETEATTSKEPRLPPEVDAFFKGKNKYKHPYGDWKPVIREDPLKRLVLNSIYVLSIVSFSFSVKLLVSYLIYRQTTGIYRRINPCRW